MPAQLSSHGTRKGPVKFTPDKPVPASLVKEPVTACLAESEPAMGSVERR